MRHSSRAASWLTLRFLLPACAMALGADWVNMARAFMFAGTPTVVSSLWTVADDSSEALMLGYYANLVGGMDKAEALRQAQLATRTDPRWASPYYWAPFALWGDWESTSAR